MTPDDAVAATAAPIHDIPSYFMLDVKTYQRGFELGFPGFDFYFLGRAGVLGRVAPDVVAGALVYFNPDVVRAAWVKGIDVMVPRDASAIFAVCGHNWAKRIPDEIDAERLAELAGRIIATASPAGVPLFAGWRAMPEPNEAKALVLHRLNVLRELRGGFHAMAVMTAGISLPAAVRVGDPELADFYGWPEDPPGMDAEAVAASLFAAGQVTNRMLVSTFAQLHEDELDEFAMLSTAVHEAVKPGATNG